MKPGTIRLEIDDAANIVTAQGGIPVNPMDGADVPIPLRAVSLWAGKSDFE